MADPQQTPSGAVEQPSLFFPQPTEHTPSQERAALVEAPPLTVTSTLGACALPYQIYLTRTDHSAYTVVCFLSDLRLFADFAGRNTELRSINRTHLTRWLSHLKWDGAAPPAPKTIARRVTFLKNFFGWLSAESVIKSDPAANIAVSRPSPPLPELLFDDEVARLERAAADDPRCHVLVMLLLATGLKKEEVMGLRLSHVDVSDSAHPAVEVHFPGQAKRRRERRMELPVAWTEAYLRYVKRYQPQERLFECTDRNLNYVLAAAVKRARLDKRVTLQLLRDIYAVRQLKAGVPMEALREKLGLSEEAWYETAEKYRKLAFSA